MLNGGIMHSRIINREMILRLGIGLSINRASGAYHEETPVINETIGITVRQAFLTFFVAARP